MSYNKETAEQEFTGDPFDECILNEREQRHEILNINGERWHLMPGAEYCDLRDAYITTLGKVQHWIPVSERLPENACECLVFKKLGKYSYIKVHRYADNIGFFDYDSEVDTYNIHGVTHWMHIPIQPQEQLMCDTCKYSKADPMKSLMCPCNHCLFTFDDGTWEYREYTPQEVK